MNVSRSRAYLAGGLAAAAAGVLGLALTVVPSVAEGASGGAGANTRPVADPSPKQPGGHTVLTCAVSTNGQPITADPAVGKDARTVTATGAVTLTNCSSPDGSFPNIRSGTATFKGTGQASCTGIQNVAGTGTITWKDAQGQTLGTSTVRPNMDGIASYNPGDMMLVGEVTEGKLKGKRIAGKAAPTSDISQCSSKGVSSAEGSGTAAFIAVDTPK